MNERILELRTQAAAWVAKNHQPQNPNAYSQKEIDQRYLMYEEKFAELIVRECAKELREAEQEADRAYKAKEVKERNTFDGYDFAHMLEERFGVGE